jgi:hypothetical protein
MWMLKAAGSAGAASGFGVLRCTSIDASAQGGTTEASGGEVGVLQTATSSQANDRHHSNTIRLGSKSIEGQAQAEIGIGGIMYHIATTKKSDMRAWHDRGCVATQF